MGRHKRSTGKQSRRKDLPSASRTDTTSGSARTKKQKLSERQSHTSSTAETKRPRVVLDDSSDEEEEDRPTDYELLLSTLKPLKKKPRLERRDEKDHVVDSCAPSGEQLELHRTEREKGERTEVEKIEGEGERLGDSDGEGSDFEEVDDAKKDPFCKHVEKDLEEKDVEQLKETFSQPLKYNKEKVKRRLANLWRQVKSEEKVKDSDTPAPTSELFSPLQGNLFAIMNSYKDLLFTRRTFANGEEIRRTYLLHALNHVLKTRSRVLKNNAKLSHAAKEGTNEMELRDRGLTRPKVLIILPFREAALKTVNTLISLLLPSGEGQVSHRKRFMDEFREEEHLSSKVPKPASYQEMFAGNIDDCFRVGVAVKRNMVRLYSKFYSSDIIIASPLGLRPIIGAEGDKDRDYDFLSSLELVIIDQADVYLMQNWDHLLHLFSHLHLQPKESHGTDFSRVRMWSLNGWAKYYRQTLIFSSFTTPEINSLFNIHCHNFAGKVKVSEVRYSGSIAHVAVQVPQTFHRVHCDSHLNLAEARWKYFTDKVLPEFTGELMKQTAIFIPSYFDFIRLRNHMRREEMDFVPLSEHTSSSDVSRARSHFFHGHTHFLLYTERMHFFHRYYIRGIKHLVFYSLPNYPEFYPELVNMLEGVGKVGGAMCTVLYSTYDALSLSRIVGTNRVGKMINSTEHIHTLIPGMW